jgi:hypothetical protein
MEWGMNDGKEWGMNSFDRDYLPEDIPLSYVQ